MTTELSIITEKELQNAGTVLQTTKSWVAGYTKKQVKLLELAKKEGEKLTPETDQLINDFIASVKKACTAAENARKPYTQKFDEVVKMFTEQEKALKVDLVTDLQNARNVSVAAYKRQEAIDAAAEQKKLDKAKARIELFANAESQIRLQYSNLLNGDKEKLMEVYENCTLEMYESVLEMLEMVVGTFTQDMWEVVKATITQSPLDSTKYFTQEELTAICTEAREGKFDKVAPHYQTEIQAYAQHLVTLMPERKLELETGAAESAAAVKLKQEQADAEAEQIKLAEAKTEQVIQSQVSSAIIDSQISAANRSVSMPKSQAIESYEIIVEGNLGWSEIFKFYVSHADLSIEGKTKMESMKLFAERVAKSKGLKIESAYIKYEEKYKAVTKSKKAA